MLRFLAVWWRWRRRLEAAPEVTGRAARVGAGGVHVLLCAGVEAHRVRAAFATAAAGGDGEGVDHVMLLRHVDARSRRVVMFVVVVAASRHEIAQRQRRHGRQSSAAVTRRVVRRWRRWRWRYRWRWRLARAAATAAEPLPAFRASLLRRVTLLDILRAVGGGHVT